MNRIILCADDYALTDAVSAAIEQLAVAQRLSATSALVTTRHWAVHGRRVEGLARIIQVGLHLDFTLGSPLSPMPKLAPDGTFPRLGRVLRLVAEARIHTGEIERETLAQIARFREVAGRDPDFIDGHQHVHALPGFREGVLDAVDKAFPERRPWLRDPTDRPRRIFIRQAAVVKSLVLAALAAGFGPRARGLGFRTNLGFSGISSFDRRMDYGVELKRFLADPGPQHLVMCHPGHVDDELRDLDPVVERRQDEYDVLLSFPGLPERISHRASTDGAA